MILASIMVLKMEEITPYVTDARFQASETVIEAHIWIRILQIRRVRGKMSVCCLETQPVCYLFEIRVLFYVIMAKNISLV